MGFFGKLIGGAIKTTVGLGSAVINVADETLSGDLEYNKTSDSLEDTGDGLGDIISAPLSLLDPDDDED